MIKKYIERYLELGEVYQKEIRERNRLLYHYTNPDIWKAVMSNKYSTQREKDIFISVYNKHIKRIELFMGLEWIRLSDEEWDSYIFQYLNNS